MSQLTQDQGLEKVLTYPFEDPHWVGKLLTAALLLFTVAYRGGREKPSKNS